ncbi:unnamed protein product, partial [Prorocentrum cordatum]
VPRGSPGEPLHFEEVSIHVVLPVPVVGTPVGYCRMQDDRLQLNAGGKYQRPCVVVQGLWKTGTHALHSYMERHFDVEVRKSRWDGCVSFNGRHVWKHDLLLTPLEFPPEDEQGRPVVVLVCTREPTRWIRAMSKGAYELMPNSASGTKRVRRMGDVSWLLRGPRDEPVHVRWPAWAKGRVDCDPEFEDAFDLWCHYMAAVLHGTGVGSPASPTHRVLVVRHEDLVCRPELVLNELVRAGLQTKGLPFHPERRLLGGHHTDKGRAVEALREEVQTPVTLDDQMVDCMVSRAQRYKGLFATCWCPPADGKLPVDHVSVEDVYKVCGAA